MQATSYHGARSVNPATGGVLRCTPPPIKPIGVTSAARRDASAPGESRSLSPAEGCRFNNLFAVSFSPLCAPHTEHPVQLFARPHIGSTSNIRDLPDFQNP
jgi:hypothetical protein